MNEVFWTQLFGFLGILVIQIFSYLRLRNEAKKVSDKAEEAGIRAVKASQILRGDIAENTKISATAARIAIEHTDESKEVADKLATELKQRADSLALKVANDARAIEVKVEQAKQSMDSLMDFMEKRARAAAERKGVIE